MYLDFWRKKGHYDSSIQRGGKVDPKDLVDHLVLGAPNLGSVRCNPRPPLTKVESSLTLVLRLADNQKNLIDTSYYYLTGRIEIQKDPEGSRRGNVKRSSSNYMQVVRHRW